MDRLTRSYLVLLVGLNPKLLKFSSKYLFKTVRPVSTVFFGGKMILIQMRKTGVEL